MRRTILAFSLATLLPFLQLAGHVHAAQHLGSAAASAHANGAQVPTDACPDCALLTGSALGLAHSGGPAACRPTTNLATPPGAESHVVAYSHWYSSQAPPA